jgi:L-seryl-tRNA(Ser) seleniumtransferase
VGIYERLGVRPVISATCHWTVYGGTVMWPEVLDAMREASTTCVDMRQLLDRASAVICRHTHAEAAHVVSGCAAGLQAGAAAILAGEDPARMARLPDTRGLKNEFVSRRYPRRADALGDEYPYYGYAHAVRGAGGIFVEVGDKQGVTAEQFEAGFGPQTAGVYWVADGADESLSLAEVIRIAHRHGVPVLVDASNTLPPAEHLHAFIDLGADLVAFSGGKGLRGPQGSGILTGRADLLRGARKQSAPNQGIGRPFKVSKEEIVGLLTALEIYASRDHARDLADAQRRTRSLVERLAGLPGVRAEYRFPDHVGRPYPTAFVHLDPAGGRTAAQVIERLLAGEPSVAVMNDADPYLLRVDVRILSDEEAEIVARRLVGELSGQERGRAAGVAGTPTARGD